MTLRSLAAGLFIFIWVGSGSALAINWEGHEDWLEDSPHAQELERQFKGRAAPLPLTRTEPDCQKRDEVGVVPANPYEPVPMLCPEESTPRD